MQSLQSVFECQISTLTSKTTIAISINVDSREENRLWKNGNAAAVFLRHFLLFINVRLTASMNFGM